MTPKTDKAQKWKESTKDFIDRMDDLLVSTKPNNLAFSELERFVTMTNQSQALIEALKAGLRAQKHRSVNLLGRDVILESDCWCSGADGHSELCLETQALLGKEG